MIKEATETEKLIKETAKRIFFAKGHINASTKEIAEAAGVNRALIHYYFRSRDFLFNMIFEEAMRGVISKIGTILGSEVDLRAKVKSFLNTFIEETADFPYLETFMITEMAKDPEKMADLHPKNTQPIKELLQKQIQAEVDAGTMLPIKVDHFMVNMMSMANYPLVAKPMIQTIFGYDEAAYRTFLMERKKVVYQNLFGEKYPED